jgi:small GTP-binding protein
MENRNKKLKIIVVGDYNVGKSTFIESYITNYNSKRKIDHTITNDVITYKINHDNKETLLLFCDFSGVQQSKQTNKVFFHNTDGIIVMFDLTNIKSLENIKSWLIYCNESLGIYNQEPTPFIIVGNKLDLIEDIDNIKVTEINNIMKDVFNITEYEYIQCSSINKTNFSTSINAMDILLNKISEYNLSYLNRRQSDTNIINLTIEEIINDNCACTSQ